MTTHAMRRHATHGMTLIELLVALTIFGIVITSAVAFTARQNSAFQESLVRLGALRNLRYALTTLEQDLQTLGTNVPTRQPGLLYAGGDVIVFSADYATNVPGDPFAELRMAPDHLMRSQGDVKIGVRRRAERTAVEPRVRPR